MHYLLKTIRAALEANSYSAELPVKANDIAESIAYYYPPAALAVEKLLQDVLEFVQYYG